MKLSFNPVVSLRRVPAEDAGDVAAREGRDYSAGVLSAGHLRLKFRGV